MDGMYCCSYMRFAVRAGLVAAVVGLVLFAAASLAGAQTAAAEPALRRTCRRLPTVKVGEPRRHRHAPTFPAA